MIDQVLVIMGVTFLILVSPGPDMVLVMRNTLTRGRRAGLLTSLGILAGNLVHISYCLLGIGWLISRSVIAFSVLKYAGAVYLIYLGLSSFRSGETSLDPPVGRTPRRERSWFTQGFINNLLNPKGTLFYLGIFSVVIEPGTSAGVTAILVLIMQSMCVVFWLFFVLTLDHPAIRRSLERFQQTVHRIFGALLVFLGIRVLMLER